MLKFDSVSFSYGPSVPVLNNLTAEFTSGEFVAVVGPSGAGKSTLLNLACGLSRPTSGTVSIDERPLGYDNERELSDLRASRFGFVYQDFRLLPQIDALANVELTESLRPANGLGAEEALTIVGLADRIHHLPLQLSGGQQQRVAIARALVGRPDVFLADEPTGSLDGDAAELVLGLLRKCAEWGSTIIVVTHDPVVVAFADRSVRLVSADA